MISKDDIFRLLTSCFLIVTLSFSTQVNAYDDQALKANQISVGQFVQTKDFKALKRPYISRGRFVYAPNKGMLWQTTSPVEGTKLFTPEGVFSITKEGKKIQEAKVDSDFFFSLFSGEREKLTKYFIVKNMGECLELVPSGESIARLFKQVNLCLLGKVPTKITLFETNGNTTTIELVKSLQAVSIEELGYFD